MEFSRIKEKYKVIGNETPDKIIEELVSFGESWAGGYPQNDDITFVIVKFNNKAGEDWTI